MPSLRTTLALSLTLPLALALAACGTMTIDLPDPKASRLANSFDADSVKAKLEARKTPFTVDSDGDFSILVDVGNDRTQQVWVLAGHESTDHMRIREIWSPGFEAETDAFSPELANDLLERSHLLKVGSWVKQGRTAMLVVKLPADAGADELDDAINLAAASADALELELTGKDEL